MAAASSAVGVGRRKRWQLPHLRSPIGLPTLTAGSSSRSAAAWLSRWGLLAARRCSTTPTRISSTFTAGSKRGFHDLLTMENDERLFYAARAPIQRAVAPGKGTLREEAAIFYYLNRTGFNGLCRFNARWIQRSVRALRESAKAGFRGVPRRVRSLEFTCTKFQCVPLRRRATSSTPIRRTTSSSRQYSRDGFGWD